MAKRSYEVTFNDGKKERIGADTKAQIERVYGSRGIRSIKLLEDYTKEAPRERTHWNVHSGTNPFAERRKSDRRR